MLRSLVHWLAKTIEYWFESTRLNMSGACAKEREEEKKREREQQQTKKRTWSEFAMIVCCEYTYANQCDFVWVCVFNLFVRMRFCFLLKTLFRFVSFCVCWFFVAFFGLVCCGHCPRSSMSGTKKVKLSNQFISLVRLPFIYNHHIVRFNFHWTKKQKKPPHFIHLYCCCCVFLV